VVFAGSAALMVALGLVLSRTLPYRKPEARMSYGALIGSMARLAARTPILRLRAFYQSFCSPPSACSARRRRSCSPITTIV
jgi:hypothetical protein